MFWLKETTEVFDGLKLTTDQLRVRRSTHCATPLNLLVTNIVLKVEV